MCLPHRMISSVMKVSSGMVPILFGRPFAKMEPGRPCLTTRGIYAEDFLVAGGLCLDRRAGTQAGGHRRKTGCRGAIRSGAECNKCLCCGYWICHANRRGFPHPRLLENHRQLWRCGAELCCVDCAITQGTPVGIFHVLFDRGAQLSGQSSEMRRIADIIPARPGQVHFQIELDFAGTLGQHQDTICQK